MKKSVVTLALMAACCLGLQSAYALPAVTKRCPDCAGKGRVESWYGGYERCEKCGGIVKPDVVLYEEGLDDYTIRKSVEAIADADVLIIGGTSLNVYPAAGFINYYNGKKLVLINMSETPYDRKADLLIHESIGKVLKECTEDL